MNFDYHNKNIDSICTPHQLKVLNAKREHGTITAAAKVLGTTEHNVKSALLKIRKKSAGIESEPQVIMEGTKQHPRHRRGKLTGNRFIFTSAQNNTLPNEEMLNTLEQMCSILNAQLFIGGFTYARSEQSRSEKSQTGFSKRLEKYMLNEQMEIAEGLTWCGELNILPTAQYPAGQYKSYCGSDSLIIPHAKAQLESVASEIDRDAKLVFTTGAVTQLNYIQKSAGQKAEWDHIFGAVMVEIDDCGNWHARDLNFESKTGHVYDLGMLYTQDGHVDDDYFVDVVSLPDAHIDKVSDAELEPWLSMLDRFNPRYITSNDTHDHSRRNHHNIKDPYFRFRHWVSGDECVRSEVARSVWFLNKLQDYVRDSVVVVESNHDIAIERWLKEQDYRADPVNALFFLELQKANYEFMQNNPQEVMQSFKVACEIVNGGEFELVRFLETDEPFRIGGVVHGQHGHNGTGGSRGSIRQYARLGEKYTKGHSHKAGRIGGVYENGVMMRRKNAGYVKGQDAWSGAFTLQYVNGKRQMLIMRDSGRFCL